MLPESCDQCQNGSTCRVITETHVSKFTCQCVQGWIGSTCNTRVWLSVANVTMDTVTLTIHVNGTAVDSGTVENKGSYANQTSVRESVTIGPDSTQRLAVRDLNILSAVINSSDVSISVHFWLKQPSNLCNVLPNVTQDTLTVFMLHSDAEYTFCVFTSQHDLCLPRLTEKSSTRHNCVAARTKVSTEFENKKLILYTIILSCVSGVFLICLIVIVVFSIRHNIFQQLICVRIRNRNKKRSQHKVVISPIQMAKLDTENQTIELENLHFDSTVETTLLNSPTCPRVQVNPPRSPGKPKHQLVKERVNGYAAFSAKNEQTLPLAAVLEYDEETTHFSDFSS